MNPGIIAKLAAGVADYYEITQQLLSQPTVANLVPKVCIFAKQTYLSFSNIIPADYICLALAVRHGLNTYK
jgi:hypothetical protein